MGLLLLKNIVGRHISSSTSIATRLCCSTNTTLTGLSSSTLKPTYDFPKFTFFSQSRFSSVHLWKTEIGSLSLGVIDKRTLFSDSNELEEPFDCSKNDLDPNSDVDKVYKTIMDNSHLYSNLGKALDNLGVGLTTDLVSEILNRLRRDEKLAFRFFHWAGHRPNYDHESNVYSSMIDILSRAKNKIKQFRILCEMLEYMKLNNKKVVPVEDLFPILSKYSEMYSIDVLKYAKKKMKKKTRVKTQPEVQALNWLLDSFCKCGLVEDAEELLRQMEESLEPDASTFNVLFFGWCRVRNPERAVKVLQKMLVAGLKPDTFTYVSGIDMFCTAGMLDGAVKLFEFTRKNHFGPSAKVYAIMIVELIKRDQVDKGFEYLGLMTNSGCLPDVATYKELIEGMCLAGKVDVAYKFLDEMGNRGYPCDIVTYNCFLKVLCDNKQRDEASRLLEVMVGKGCEPSVQTYNMLISMLFEIGNPDMAIARWDDMRKRGCAQDCNTYCAAIEGLFRCGRVEAACALLEEVVTKGMKLPYKKFDLFLMELSRIGDLQAIHRLSEHMSTFYKHRMEMHRALSEQRMRIHVRGKR